jgi:membrane fusion protein, multidrug efflux system
MQTAMSPRISLYAVLLLGTLAGCGKPHTAATAAAGTPVTVLTLVARRIRDEIELDGSVSPMQQVNLVARVAGTLEQIKFKDGDRVRAGQVLFIIEQPPYIDQIKLNEAKLDQTRADYQRQSELLKENASSQANVETSLSNMKQAEANVSLAKLNLDYTVVKAPFDGVIGRRDVDAGNFVGATQGGTVLATLMQISPAYVYASIGERDALRVRARMPAGQTATQGVGRAVVHARLQGDPEPGEAGVLDFIDHQVNQASGTVQLRGRFENRDYHLVPGFYAKLRIEVGTERDALVLANSLIQSDQQGDFVFVVAEDLHAHRRNVTALPLKGEEKEITSGLNAGERVVVKGADRLTDGVPVQIMPSSGG